MADEEDFGQAPACNGCMNWDKFEKKCWVYWDLKKDCSHFADGAIVPGTPEDAIKTAIPKQVDLGAKDKVQEPVKKV